MLAMLLRRLAAALLFALAGLALLEQFNPQRPAILIDAAPHTNPASPIRKSDFPACVTLRPPPLLRSPQHHYDLRLGKPFNDKGTA